MDWKRFYANELASPQGRAAALAAIAHHAHGHAAIQAALQAGGIASFPHVSIHDSADAIASVAQAILQMGAQHVVALGVLHGGTLPPPYRDIHATLRGSTPQADEAFRQLGGAVVARGSVQTPFGTIDEGRAPPPCDLIKDDAAILANEFSLDLFLALLAAAALVRGTKSPPVTRLYISATRSPDGNFHTAAALATVIEDLMVEELMAPGTVCVATGDVVHIGHTYTPAADVAAIPTDPATLAATLTPQIHQMHQAALAHRDFDTAWAVGTRLLSDQRHMLPVIAHLVGPDATAELLSFQLSDYSRINGAPPPCFVAAALSLFRPA